MADELYEMERYEHHDWKKSYFTKYDPVASIIYD